MPERIYRSLSALALLVLLAVLSGPLLAQPAGHTAEHGGEGHARLADLLEDESTRQALIEQLRAISAETSIEQTEAAAQSRPSFPRRIANLTQATAEGVVRDGVAAAGSVRSAWSQFEATPASELAGELIGFGALVAATLVLFALSSYAAGFAFRVLDAYAQNNTSVLPALRRAVAIIAAILVHLAAIFLAWLAGYALAMSAIGEPGEITVQESLFLNAFLAVELVRAVIRTLLSNRYEGLRLVPTSGESSAYWSAWLSRMVLFLGYGLLLVVPTVNHYVSTELGRVVAIVIMLMAFLKAAVIVMQNRGRVREAIESLAERTHTSFARVSLNMTARVWHIVAMAYLGAVLATAVLYPEQALPFMIGGTVQTLLAVLVGVGVSAFLTGVILRRIRLPDDTRAKFPLLESRLNAYIPTALKITRFTILAVVVAVVLDAWSLFDLPAWVTSDAGTRFIGKLITVSLIIGFALFLWLLAASWIEFKLNPGAGTGEPSPRVKTLLTIFRNAIAITLIVMTVMVVLAEIGVNIGPLIAGAGVLGLAIGFGAQKLVQDVITGVFIQLEGAINVGDVVTGAGTTGVVEKLTIRSMGLRDLSGTYHLLPFSAVDTVSNYMRDFAYHVGEYGVGYREDTDEVIVHLRAAFDELRSVPEHAEKIIGELEVHGVTALADSSVNVRVRIKTLPGSQFAIGREYNRLVKRHFDAAGIEIPFPHLTLYFGEDKQGKAPPARLDMVHRRVLPAGSGKRKDRLDEEDARSNPKFKGDFDDAEDD